MRIRAALAACATVLLVMLGPAAATAQTPPGTSSEAAATPPALAAADGAGRYPLYIVFDTSGSMADGDPEPKIDAARRSLYTLTRDLPSAQEVSLITYPAGLTNIEGCNAGAVKFGPSQGRRDELSAAIRGMTADGDTPTGPTLLHVKKLFEQSGKKRGTVVLVSDGEANCGETDVCEVARQLNDTGLDLTVNTVGFDNSDEGNDQLTCIADATGGISVTADDADSLRDQIAVASRGALDVAVSAPAAFQSVTGGALLPAGVNALTVDVDSVGSEPAKDVRVSLRITDGDGREGAVYTPTPVRYLGNLRRDGPGAGVTFTPRPSTGTPGPLSYIVTASADNAATIERRGTVSLDDADDRATAGPILRESEHVVIMGDSYSSGEGAGSYDGADDYRSGEFKCHRSADAWGRQLFRDMPAAGQSKRTVSMIACSGATTKHLYNYQDPWVIGPQLAELRDLAEEQTPPDLVMLTLGGNDVGFGEFVTACVLRNFLEGKVTLTGRGAWQAPCGRRIGEPISGRLTEQLRRDLPRVYKDINSVVNRPEVVDRRGGRVAQIVVLPYANPLPPQQRIRKGCFLGLSEIEAAAAQMFLDTLNLTIRTSVAEAQDAGVPIHRARNVVDAFQDGHTICDKDTAVRTDGLPGKWAGEEVFGAVDDGYKRVSELMHPSALGQSLQASALVEWSRSEPVDWSASYRAPDRAIDVETRVERLIRWPVGADRPLFAPRLATPLGHVPQRCDRLFTTVECETISESKIIVMSLYSTPSIVGVVEGGEPDQIFADLRWPETTVPGKHELVVTGVDASGQPVEAATEIVIYPQGTLRNLALALSGLVLLAIASVMRWRRRRPTASSPPRTDGVNA